MFPAERAFQTGADIGRLSAGRPGRDFCLGRKSKGRKNLQKLFLGMLAKDCRKYAAQRGNSFDGIGTPSFNSRTESKTIRRVLQAIRFGFSM